MPSGIFGFEQVRHTPNVPKDCFGFTHIDFCCKRAGKSGAGLAKTESFDKERQSD